MFQSKKRKVTILFGAGAEVAFGISGGRDFARHVIGIEPKGLNDRIFVNEQIKRHYLEELEKCTHKEWYPEYKEHSWNEDHLLEAAVRKKFLEEESFSTKNEYDREIKEKISSLRDEANKQEYDWVINEYTSYMGLLDERFHTLISPKMLGPQKFWSVVSCYTRAYLSVVRSLICSQKAYTAHQCLESYNMLQDHEKTMREIICACEEKSNYESYYSVVRSLDASRYNIVSTNYTPLCRIITGISYDRTANIHGRLGLFESPYEMRVYDVEKEALPDNEILFPYIFIQSGVKPIVEKKQLLEFGKMIRFFEESDRIVIVGYRINYDDNHITGILRSCLLEGKEIVYLDYNEEPLLGSNLCKEKIMRRIRLDENLSNLKYEKIDNNNCYEVFLKSVDFIS